jgi:hypothetical protein
LNKDKGKKTLRTKARRTLTELTMAQRAKTIESRAKPKISPLPTLTPTSPKTVDKEPVPEIRHKPPANFVDRYELPHSYGNTSLTLIAKDPFWIYAYWEIAPHSIDMLKERIGAEFTRSTYVLRMYDVTAVDFNGHNANHSFDIDVGLNANNWYINLWCDNVSYCADLGMRSPDGRFHHLARSNFVTTPRANPSNRSEEIWMEVKDNSSRPPFVIGAMRGRPNHRASEQKGEVSVKRDDEKAGLEGSRQKIFLSEEDIREYYSRLSPLLRDVVSARLERNDDGKKFNAGRLTLYDVKGNKVVLDDFLIKGPSKDKFIKRLLLGSSQELVFLGASEFAAGGASEMGLKEKKRKFFFEFGTELIVYGRTEPDAEVWLGGKKIMLRSDGTFSLRFALSDASRIPLDFTAISNDKVGKREARTAVERTKTKYNP